ARRGISGRTRRRLLVEPGRCVAQLGARACLRAVDGCRREGGAVSWLEKGRRQGARLGGALSMHPGRGRPAGIACGIALAAAITVSGADSPPRLLVLQKKASTLGLYDSTTGARIWTAAVGSKPHEMVLSPGDRYAYVTDYGVDSYGDAAEGGRTISIVDL